VYPPDFNYSIAFYQVIQLVKYTDTAANIRGNCGTGQTQRRYRTKTINDKHRAQNDIADIGDP
jgi:hypothetical protein